MQIPGLILFFTILFSCGSQDIKQRRQGMIAGTDDLLKDQGKSKKPGTTEPLSGAALYQANCSGCHGAIAESTIKGRKFDSIKSALGGIVQMSGIRLEDAEVRSIADYLWDNRKFQATGGLNPFVCDPEDEGTAKDVIRRLSQVELLNTYLSLFSAYVPVAEVTALLNDVPRDRKAKVFGNQDFSLSYGHVQNFYFQAKAIGRIAVNHQAFLNTEVGCTGTMTDACWNQFFSGFAARIVRRPLSQAEQIVLKGFFLESSSTPDGIHAIITALLNSPDFLFHVETGAEELSPKNYSLSQFELANRLAYSLTGSPPDSELRQAAAAGSVSSGIPATAVRLLNSPAGRDHVRGFYREFYGYDILSSGAYPQDFLDGLDAASIAEDSRGELDRLTSSLTFEDQANYSDLFLSRKNANASNTLHQIYSSSPQASLLPASRAGVISRVGFVLNSGEAPSLLHRGLKFAVNLSCNQIGSPAEVKNDDGTPLTPFTASPDSSLREQIETNTASQRCQACHGLINPPAFAFYAMDSLGRITTLEKVYDGGGNLVAQHPVVSASKVQIDDAEVDVEDAASLGLAMAKSSQGPGCFSIRWLEYSRRDPSAGIGNACWLSNNYQALMGSLASGQKPVTDRGSLLRMFQKSVEFDTFLRVRK